MIHSQITSTLQVHNERKHGCVHLEQFESWKEAENCERHCLEFFDTMEICPTCCGDGEVDGSSCKTCKSFGKLEVM